MKIITGDILDQDAEAIVNPWNANIFPHWLLRPQGVSGRIRQAAGTAPFRALWHHGRLRPGDAVLTDGGKLPVPLIHVAGLSLLWRSSAPVVYRCVVNALVLADRHDLVSLAIPLIGAGTGGLNPAHSLRAIRTAVTDSDSRCEARIIIWPGNQPAT